MKRNIFVLLFVVPFFGMTQVIDDFSDGNFTENPPWNGDRESFEVNTSGQLHLKATGADTASLVTQNSMIVNTEWDFWIKLSFNTSANNFARIYLAADNAELKGNINGYYLQIGGSNDSIAFVRQNGALHHILIRGAYAYTGNSVNVFRIRVIHDKSGIWHLLSDNTGNSNFIEEGSWPDNTFTQSSVFGIFCKFTSSNSTKFYFDDLYIGPVIIDSVPPDVSSASANTDSILTVAFTEVVDPDVAAKTDNYFIPGHGSPFLAERDSINFSILRLTFDKKFDNGSCDTLVITNMKDLKGNESGKLKTTFCFYQAKTFDIVISEIMADPTPQTGLPDAEYAELFNRTSFPISLKGWFFQAGATNKVLPDITLYPNSFLTLTKGALLSFYGASVDLFTSVSTLTNEGTTLTLKNDKNQVIHSVSYSIDWYQNSLKENGGWSLEMIDPSNPCGCKENWSASVDPSGGTPSAPNSIFRVNPDTLKPYLKRVIVDNDSSVRIVFSEAIDSSSFGEAHMWKLDKDHPAIGKLIPGSPGYNQLVLQLSSSLEKGILYKVLPPENLKDCAGNQLYEGSSLEFAIPGIMSGSEIVINEILANPFPYGERFIELYNRSEEIFDLKNLVLLDPDTASDDGFQPVSISDDGFLFFPESFVVLTKDPPDIFSRYRVPNPDCFIQMGKMPSMNDEKGTLIIARKYDLAIIDRVSYDKNMNFPLLNSPDGVSLERINPSGPSENPSNWHSAAGSCGYATPGYRNSQFSDPGFSENLISFSSEIFSPDNDGKDDILIIKFHFDKPGYLASVAVFSSSGRLSKNLVRKELISPEGFFSWDGTTDDNTRAAIGLYIIKIDLFSPDGTIKQFKKAVVLGGRF